MHTNIEMNRTTTTTAERKTISIMKACELVGVSRRTIYNWIAGGKVEYVRTAGGSVRIFVDTLWREPDRTADLERKEAS
jgi:excisionase family DNA binding protein